MTSVDGRIDCPMVGQLSTDEYYIALDRLGKCSKLSGRVTTVLECPAVKEEVAAGIDGREGQTAMFDGIRKENCNPYKLKLESVEKWDTDIVWLRYKVEK